MNRPHGLRIVGGIHRGRRLVVPAGDHIRPTGDRARESLFNRLIHGGYGPGGTSALAAARVLDAFCGTGALGLEALSRGAAAATFMDRDRRALDCARANADALGEIDRCRFLATDTTRPPAAPADGAVRLVFLDPPYASDLAMPALTALAAAGWLAPDAIAVVETAADTAPDPHSGPSPEPPSGFTLLDTRTTGAARHTLLRHTAP